MATLGRAAPVSPDAFMQEGNVHGIEPERRATHRARFPDLRTPGQRNVDLNLFDNPLFTTLQSQLGTPTFGQLTAVGGYARSVQFQARFGF